MGEVVVDFGCGGGIDVVLAARMVGTEGRVIGLDFAPQMIEQAKTAVAEAGMQDRKIALSVSEMENSLLPDSFSDVVISNCVINLSPDKEAVYGEAFRILKPGGRLAISDIVLIEPIDPRLQKRFQSTWSGCLGGAISEGEYWPVLAKSGFQNVKVLSRHTLSSEELTSMAVCPGEEFTPAPVSEDLAIVQGKVVSVKFTATKQPS